MVRQLFILLYAGLCCVSAQAAVHLNLHADKTRTRLGEPLTVTLRVEDAHEPMSDIALDGLKQNFNVYSATGSSETHKVRGHPQRIDTLILVLYPLHVGKLQLPALNYHGHKSPVLQVKVDGPDAAVNLDASLDVPHPVVRQVITLTLEVRDDGTMQWTVPHQLTVSGAYPRWLGESQREEQLGDKRVTVHRYAWEVMPLRDGVMEVEFPLLDAFRLGNRLRFPVDKLQSYVAPVPAYLPVQVPVGKPEVIADPLPGEIAAGRPYNRTITIRHGGLNAEGMRKLLPAFSSNAEVKYYPLQFESGAEGRGDAGNQTLRVIIPFVAQHSGLIPLPEIQLPYYDLGLGRMESISVPGVTLDVYSQFWQQVRRVMASLIVVVLLGWGGHRFLRLLRCLRSKRQVLAAIRAARDAATLHATLMRVGTASSIRTLQQWQAYMMSVSGVKRQLPTLVQQLEFALYGTTEQTVDIARLAKDFAETLQHTPCSLFSSP